MGKIPPPPPFALSRLETGNVLSYPSYGVIFQYEVLDTSDERRLPLVEVTAVQVSNPGYEIVNILKASHLRGILLGSCDFDSGQLVKEGYMFLGNDTFGVAVEMSFEGQLVKGIFPSPPRNVMHLNVA